MSPKESLQLENNVDALKKSLSKDEKKMLLRIIDGKDLIRCITSEDSFKQGVQIGLKLATDVYEHGKEL